MSCSCVHLLNSRILENPDLPTARFTIAISLTPFLFTPNDFTAYHCLLNSNGKIFDDIKNAEKTIPAFKGFQKVPFKVKL